MPEKQNFLKGQDGVKRIVYRCRGKRNPEDKEYVVISSSTPHLYTEHRGHNHSGSPNQTSREPTSVNAVVIEDMPRDRNELLSCACLGVGNLQSFVST